MRFSISSSAWWGPPKKFDRDIKERRISWLELFYDLVYVIAIARITHLAAIGVLFQSSLAAFARIAHFVEIGTLFQPSLARTA